MTNTIHKYRTKTWYGPCLALFILLISSADATGQHANHARGFKSESYSSDSIDHTNLFNGNLSLTIPIGQKYNAGGSLTYGLTLVYNSNVWEFRTAFHCEFDTNCGKTKAEPDPKTNAGMGWHLSLGRLYVKDSAAWLATFPERRQGHVYIGPDGAEHEFYSTLHPGDVVENANYFYTRDSSYLRLHKLGGIYEIEFPDGQIHSFNGLGKITQIRDRWLNALNITYGLTQWVLTDSTGRTHFINFRDSSQTTIANVNLAAFDNSRAVYNFTYHDEPTGRTTIPRHYNNTYPWTGPNESLTVSVPLLASVSLPADAGSYQFDYYRDGGTNQQPSGAIKSATLPTLARYEWTYQSYVFRGLAPQEPTEGSIGVVLNASDGVHEKKIYNKGGVLQGTYTYTQDAQIPTRHSDLGYSSTTVRTPENDETVHYFNISGSAWDYGLPYRPDVSLKDGSLFLSEEIYDGLKSAGNKVRTVYKRYESDIYRARFSYEYASRREINTRLATENTVYNDDDDVFTQTAYSRFDGLGHYRNQVTSGNFYPPDTIQSRTTITNFNPTHGRYDYNPETDTAITTSYVQFGIGGPWILNTYSESSTGENGQTSHRQHCFGPTTGFKSMERIMGGSNPLTTDVLIRYGETNGHLTSEEYFGGDSGGAGTGEGCAAAPTGGSQYRINYGYQFGTLNSKAYAKSDGTLFFKLVDNVIDRNTGLPNLSRDTAGVATTFTYDGLGRVTRAKPEPGPSAGSLACTNHIYQTATSTARRSVTKQQLINDGSATCGAVTTQNKVFYDDLNRPVRSETLFAGGTSVQTTAYNVMGWKLTESEVLPSTPNRFTEYREFDAFGRPGKILPADAPQVTSPHAVLMTYRGDREVTRQVKTGIDFSSSGVITEADTFTTETYDQYGRLRLLGEGASDAEAKINYALSANGGFASASSFINSNFPPSAANDGDRTGRTWGSGGGWNDGTENVYPDWLQIEFRRPQDQQPESKTIDQINVYTLRDGFSTKTEDPTATETFSTANNTGQGIRDFDVQYWTGSTWALVPGGSVNNNDKVLRQFSFAPITTSKIKVLVRRGAVWISVPNNYSRIVEVEAIGAPTLETTQTLTTYSYDENNKLASVSLNGQSRSFNYDNRGFLVSETHPETGTTNYSDFDGRGHARRKLTGSAGGIFDLKTVFDRAERVSSIRYPYSDPPTSQRLLKEFTYDTCQGAGNYCNGKVVTATRHNYIDRFGWDATVTETYAYAGRGGMVSSRDTNVTLHSGEVNTFTQSYLYNDLGLVSKETYPSATSGDLMGKGGTRNVFYNYTNGQLINVRNQSNTAANEVVTFGYYANGLTSTITYKNGVVWNQGNDPNSITRPGSISATGIHINNSPVPYNLGQFIYDGDGNITGIGAERFAYDYLGRLKKSRPLDLAGRTWHQDYAYDNFANLTSVKTTDVGNPFSFPPINPATTTRSIAVSATGNRLTNATYDAAGNQTSNGNYRYAYDSFNMQQSFQEGTGGSIQDWIYLYTPNDERIYAGNIKSLTINWSLRDLGGSVLREWREQSVGGGAWTFNWIKDYFNNGRRTFAEAIPDPANPTNTLFSYYIHDHLGSVRVVTNATGALLEHHTYLPFGEEAVLTNNTPWSSTSKGFTGHERDFNGPSVNDDLVYMHARYNNPFFGRFLSVDPELEDSMNGAAGWSRYAYVRNNPVVAVDPDGRASGAPVNNVRDLEMLRALLTDGGMTPLPINPITNQTNFTPAPEGEPGHLRQSKDGKGFFGAPREGGRTHKGLDIAAPIGSSVYSMARGVVTFSGTSDTKGGKKLGQFIIIDHGYGVETRSAHLSTRLVSKDNIVAPGQLVGLSGITGNAGGTPPHLHFETRVNGIPRNPESFLSSGFPLF